MFRRFFNIAVIPAILLFTLGNACQIKMGEEKEKGIIIPLDFSTQRPVLELMIGDKGPYRFIFDTGSTTNVIDTDLAAEFGFEIVGEDSLGNPGSKNKLISNRVKVPGVNFTNTVISEDALMNTIAIQKMVAVDGILCPAFFSKYLLTIDYPGSILALSIAELDSTESDVSSYIQDPRVINLNVTVAGHSFEAHLDSGNPGGFDLPFAMKDKLKFKDEPVAAGVLNTVTASYKKWKATLDGDIRIGNITYENPEVYLVEDFTFVNLGYRVFKDLRMTLDTKNNLIKFEKPVAVLKMNEEEEDFGEQNEFTGWYSGHERKIFLDNGEMYLQRGGASRIKLVKLQQDLYEMTFPVAVNNELPNVLFIKNAGNKVIGLTFIFKDGREDFVKKDK